MTTNYTKNIGQSEFSNLLEIKTVQFEKGDVILQLEIDEKHINGIDTVHGGVIATLIDNIIGATITSIVNLPSTTINLNIQYLSPATSGVLSAKANMLHIGYKIVTGEGIIADEKGNVIAKGTGTFKILHPKSQEIN
ncbi:acyl-CoA thioesterase [Bacillus mesophilus]|uniref:PaaI family thioesterase n=1 Tax=Bacillus mesophilus TaxID=1808955 RepID=A0A6M0Q8I3_9BACI|nr:PaaI family thioesterase [Bacillus mesophilus]MBM7661969.1 acyl-CoA thioesterase [Bacillus mesophilus]NEY72672.1 PaaI family thioesterase [Bacillus mesophilus]